MDIQHVPQPEMKQDNFQKVANKQPKAQRFQFLDVMRGIAALWMIQVHVTNTLLEKNPNRGMWFDWLNISNGYVSVAFIFCAGAGFWIASERKLDIYKSFSRELWLYVRRLLFILVLAYSLHLPANSLRNLLYFSTAEQWQAFAQSDVLHVISLTSLLALGIALLSPQKILPWLFGILAVLIFIIAPFIWSINPFETLPLPLATYFAEPPISGFPIVHWSGFFFAGAFVTWLFMQSTDKRRMAWILLGAGISISTLSYGLASAGAFGGFYTGWWDCSFGHSTFRVGAPITLFALCFLFLEKRKHWFLEMLRRGGQESLFIYTFHLFLLYGTVLNTKTKLSVMSPLNLSENFAMWIVLSLVTWAGAITWNNLKKRYGVDTMRAFYIVTWSLVIAWVSGLIDILQR